MLDSVPVVGATVVASTLGKSLDGWPATGAEQALDAGNRELARRFERKIHATIAGVWGEDWPTAGGMNAGRAGHIAEDKG